ncbi:alpha/beta fold hydrolase [uncultured Jannaschia sp.]|uniref:alpha/beta fold hydrolase n=1 Tax=uncultured Jannaschia sp. TaxID=293347 RepID=UPI002632702F|nr:alpha/beta fold hydrolase [uncultured Jannaschia sp.]
MTEHSETNWHRRNVLALGGGALLATALPRAAVASPPLRSDREGFADVSGGRVWWRISGSGSRTPLLLLHGGPGAGHDYLEPLASLAVDRPIIFYDQLGCGRSDKPDDPSLWRMERFVAEIDALRRALNLERVGLYGHSWGG